MKLTRVLIVLLLLAGSVGFSGCIFRPRPLKKTEDLLNIRCDTVLPDFQRAGGGK